MKLSPKVRYAVRILFELQKEREPLSLAVLSERTGIAPRTVENVHNLLRRQDITTGHIGAKGGISLSAPLTEVSLGLLVRLLDGGVEFAVCCGDKANDCPDKDVCPRRAVWLAISATFQKGLDGVSLESILRQYPLR